MNPKVFVALAAAAAACVSVANGEDMDDDDDTTPMDGFKAGEDPWDCEQIEDGKSGTEPSQKCLDKYPADWFLTRTTLDSLCASESCLGNSNGEGAGCLLIASRFNSDAPSSFSTAQRFCGNKASLSLTNDIGLDTDITKGTPSDPLGRCSSLDELFGGASNKPAQVYGWCGEADSRPATTTADPNLCACKPSTCQPGTSGPCKYNGQDGPRISFINFCAEYQGETNECFSGFSSDSAVEVEDCCEKDDVAPPTPPPAVDDINCPAKYCKGTGDDKSKGPCIYDYTEDMKDGENICLNYMFSGDAEGNGAKCYPNSSPCKGENGIFNNEGGDGDDDVVLGSTSTTTQKATEENECKDGEYCDEYCEPELCYGETEGPCRSTVAAPCKDGDVECEANKKYLCLPYVQGTTRLRGSIKYGVELSGPRCLGFAVKCKKWTTLSTSTATSTTTTESSTTTTTTTTTTLVRKDPSAEILAKSLNELVDAWEKVYCRIPADAIAASLGEPGLQSNIFSINEGMIRAWMSQGFHIEAQDEMQEERLPEVVGEGAGEKFCAGPNEMCSCNGLVRRSVVPAVSWGSFNCTAKTFQSVANPFQPALNNADGNCYCTKKSVQQLEGVKAGKNLFELARMVGASRMCKVNKLKELDETNPKDWIPSDCTAQCRGYGDIKNMGDLEEKLQDYYDLPNDKQEKATDDQVKAFFAAKKEELQDTFEYIFRYITAINETPTNYDNYVVAAVSDGDNSLQYDHQADLKGVQWAKFRQDENVNASANQKFATAAEGLDSTFLAVGQRRAAATQSGCHAGGIKMQLGLCKCSDVVAATTTSTTTTAITTTVNGAVAANTSTTTAPAVASCVEGNSGYKGPIIGAKIASPLTNKDALKAKAKVIKTEVDKSLPACAKICKEDKNCKEFGFREGNTVDDPDKGTKCLFYNYELSINREENLRTNSPYNHYYLEADCTASTTTIITTTTTTPTPAGPTTTIAAGVAKLSEKEVVVGAECLAQGVDQIELCRERCASQHECSGIMYFYEESDNMMECETKRIESEDANGKDTFDHFETCIPSYDANNKDEESGCAAHESAFPGAVNGTYTCRPCISAFIKEEKCAGLYKLDNPKKVAAGASAAPIVACAMLTALCTDGSDECIRYDLSGLVEENSMRTISLKRKVESAFEPTTPSSTQTSSATSSATSTPSTTQASTATYTMNTTLSTTEVTTATSTASSTAISSVTSTVTSSQTSTVTSTNSFSRATSVTSTATSTAASTASSTLDTTETSTVTTTVSTTSATTTTTTSISTTTTSTTTTTTVAPFMNWKIVYASNAAPDGAAAVVGRRFGNAFSKMVDAGGDRLFQLKYDGSRAMNDLATTERKCQSVCATNPLCLAVFTWLQSDHTAIEKRRKPLKKTGYSCVGLTSERVYGNYFSYDSYMTTLTPAQLEIAKESNSSTNGILTKGNAFGEYPMIADDKNGFAGASRSTIKEFLWDANNADGETRGITRCKIGTGVDVGAYNGACKHKYTGFCMEEIPGTAKCLPGFVHAGEEYINLALDGNSK